MYMKYHSFTTKGILILSVNCAALMLTCSNVWAQLPPAPAGLAPGSYYHLLFVTSDSITGTSPNFSDYNALVNADAYDAGIGSQIGLNWYAMVSTANSYTEPSIYFDSYPVYNMVGEEVGSSPIYIWYNGPGPNAGYDEYGAMTQASAEWTGGCGALAGIPPGTPNPIPHALGDDEPLIGNCYAPNASCRVAMAPYGPSAEFSLYAISDPIMVPVTNCVPAPANLVLWLPFDETIGPVSANIAPVAGANNGLQMNGPEVVLHQYVDNSLSFNGLNQYVTVPDYPAIEIGTNDFTIDAWVNRATNSPNSALSVIVDKRDVNSGAGYNLSVWNGYIVVTLADTLSSLSVGTSSGSIVPPDGAWHFVAASVMLSGEASFYIDGVLVSTLYYENIIPPSNVGNTSSLWVGASPVSGTVPWTGDLDEVEVYNRALASNEIAGIYNAGTAGKCKPCCYLGVLTISKVTSTTVEIDWGGCGTLEEATDVTGPWIPIPNAASPCIIPITELNMFFRRECSCAFTQMVVLLPGQTFTPGAAPGYSGAPTPVEGGNSGFAEEDITVYAVDAGFNPVNCPLDIIAITTTDGTATLPKNEATANGVVTFSAGNSALYFGQDGTFTITAQDTTNPNIPDATSAFVLVEN